MCLSEPIPQALWNKEKPIIEFSNSSLNPLTDEVVLDAGDSLNVTCYSSLPAEWVVVQGEDMFVSGSQYTLISEIYVRV